MTYGYDDVFPLTDYYDEKPVGITSGLSKREYFAAMAMQGFLSGDTDRNVGYAECAAYSVRQADALIAAPNNPEYKPLAK